METGSVKEKIVKLRKEGYSYKKIKKELNCSSGYIAEICKEYKINDIGLGCRKLDSKEIEEIREYYKNHTKEETAIKFNISTRTVTKYKENKRIKLSEEEKIAKNYSNVKKFRVRIKERAVEYKGGKCYICGYDRCIKAFDFHHLAPKEKDFAISGNCNRAWDKVKKELDKCILVCANCHREIHDGMIKLEYSSIG